MRDYIELGTTLPEEDCAQVGSSNYWEKATAEAKRFISGIRNYFGEEPMGSMLKIKNFPHDFGTYREVIVYFDEDIPESVEYAFKLEGEMPATWRELEGGRWG